MSDAQIDRRFRGTASYPFLGERAKADLIHARRTADRMEAEAKAVNRLRLAPQRALTSSERRSK